MLEKAGKIDFEDRSKTAGVAGVVLDGALKANT